jgi:hypothetical protein
LIEDAAMLLQEKIFGLEIFDGGIKSVIIEQDGAEDGTFRFEILREWAFESGFSGHRESFYVSPFIRFYTMLPCSGQDECERYSAPFCDVKIAWIVRDGERLVNWSGLCKTAEGVEKFLAVRKILRRGRNRREIPRFARNDGSNSEAWIKRSGA